MYHPSMRAVLQGSYGAPDLLRVGDEVFGTATGSLAEYVSAKDVAAKPAGISFEEAASVPVAGLTALQALRDQGKVETGNKVVVNGAGGGVGTFAVQIAKALGAHVTATTVPKASTWSRLWGPMK